MRKPSRLALAVSAVCAALLSPGGSLAATAGSPASRRAPNTRALLHSRELWATIDVCDTPKQPNTIGVRGSMPGDGRARDQMSMSFHLQYLNAVNQWVELEAGDSSGYINVGTGAATRQGGWSFTLKPREGKPAFMLRGVVDFRWSQGKTVLQTASRPTTASHAATAGAEPKGFSAAACSVG